MTHRGPLPWAGLLPSRPGLAPGVRHLDQKEVLRMPRRLRAAGPAPPHADDGAEKRPVRATAQHRRARR